MLIVWNFHICFDHIHPSPGTSQIHPCLPYFFSLFPRWNPVCVTQLLSKMRPVLACSRPTRDHTTEENQILFSWQFFPHKELLSFVLDFVWLEFARWVHMCNCPSVLGKHCFLGVTHRLVHSLRCSLKRVMSCVLKSVPHNRISLWSVYIGKLLHNNTKVSGFYIPIILHSGVLCEMTSHFVLILFFLIYKYWLISQYFHIF